jgi:hypothetical protein
MSEDSHRVKRHYEWDPEQNMFVPQDVLDNEEPSDTRDLTKCSLDRLAILPEWLVPLSRRAELERYKAFRNREARTKLEDDMKSKDLRGHKSTMSPDSDGVLNRKPEVRYGPRGGRYTVVITRDERSYRRYF